jgi:hypothetical protein
MKKFTTILAAGLFTASLVSCQKDDNDITILSPVAGDFIGKETCAPAPAGADYSVQIFNTAANNGKDVFIDNIYDIGNRFTGTVSGNTITVASQPYKYVIATGANKGTYVGNITATGTVVDGVLTLDYKLDGDLADACQFVGDRDARH